MSIKWIILFIAFESHVANLYPQKCTRCWDFNRELSRNSCPSSPKACGGCLQGFRNSTTDDEACERIFPPQLIAQPPSKVYVSEGEHVDLSCTFRSQDVVDCVWLRRGFQLEISNRYKYINEKNGYKTSDCSITITNITAISDIGHWQCGNAADSRADGVMSDEFHLILEEHFIEEPVDTIVPLGSNTTLNCTFDKEVDCVWLRNSFHLEISNRYEYIDDKKGYMTRDCSIHIWNVTRRDLTRWTCGSMGDSLKDGIMSKDAKLMPPYSSNGLTTEEAKQGILNAPEKSQHITTMPNENNVNSTTDDKYVKSESSAILEAILISLSILTICLISAMGVIAYRHYKHRKPGASKRSSNDNVIKTDEPKNIYQESGKNSEAAVEDDEKSLLNQSTYSITNQM